MGRLGTKERRFLAEILFGFIRRDYRRVAEVHFEAGYVPRTIRSRISRRRCAPSASRSTTGAPTKSRWRSCSTLLFEVTGLFDMADALRTVMLQKTMVVVEGVGRMLDPKLDMWRTAEPVVRDWMERQLGPIGRLEETGRGVRTLAGVIADLPELSLRAERLLAQFERAADQGFPLAPESLDGIGRAEARRARWGTAALWVIALVSIALLLRLW